jgi:hypothetical protein
LATFEAPGFALGQPLYAKCRWIEVGTHCHIFGAVCRTVPTGYTAAEPLVPVELETGQAVVAFRVCGAARPEAAGCVPVAIAVAVAVAITVAITVAVTGVPVSRGRGRTGIAFIGTASREAASE